MKNVLRACTVMAAIIAMSLLHIGAPVFAADERAAWEEKYRDEPSVILLSERTVELRKDFTTRTTVRRVMKVQKEGAKGLGEITVDYDKSRENVLQIEAVTITPDGERLPYQKIQDVTPQAAYAIYGDQRLKIVTMPHVVVGSVLDWKATVESTKPVIPGHFYDVVHLSSFTPVREERYTLIVPKDVALHIKYRNTERKPVISHDGDTVVYRWETTDNDKIEIEEYMPPWGEIFETVTISTLGSWDEMSAWAWGLFKKNLELSDAMKAKAEELTREKQALSDKVQAIIQYIQSDFRYVAMNMDFHGYEPHPAGQVFANKYGDCKDYTLLAMSMFSAIGVRAYPVLVPSDWGFSRESLLPMPAHFNHAILYFELDGKPYFTDLLRKGYYFYEIPDEIARQTVFVVNDRGGFFRTVPPKDHEESSTLLEEKVTISADGRADSEMTALFSRSASVTMREGVRSMAEDMRLKVFSSVETALAQGGNVFNREWTNLDSPHGRVSARLNHDASHRIQKIGDMMMFGLPQRQRGGLFTTPKRTHAVFFRSDSREERRITYMLPEGYELAHLPKDVKLAHPFGLYERTYRSAGAAVTAQEIYSYRESRTPADDYQKVRTFLDDITRLTNDLVMIKKKG